MQIKKVKIYELPHTHSFTYNASGATITATCEGSGTCDITDGLTLTISAPTGNLVYDGTTTYPAALSNGYNTTAFPDTYSISYTKDGSAYSGVPKDAGTYTASVTVGTGDAAKTASVSYTIVKAAATVTKAPTAETLTYTGSAQALVDAGTATGGTMQYALGDAKGATQPYTTSIPTATNAGTYYVWYKAVGDANHTDSAAACLPVTIKDPEEKESEKESEDEGQKQPKKKIPVKDLARAKYVRDKIRAIGTVSYTDACKARIDAASIVYQEYRSHAESIGEFIRSSADFRAEMEKRGYRYRRANSGNMVNVALRDTPCIEASVRQDSFESLCRSLKHAVKKLQQSGVPILAEFIIIIITTADQTFIMSPDAGVAFL